jgi:Icc-related predicted phosphoesterase
MFIRLISDLHIDVNKKTPLVLENNDTFTIVGGDTAGDPEISIKWIKENVCNGIVVSGNHLVYNPRNKTVEELKQEFASAFPLSNAVSYLDASIKQIRKEISNKVFVLGSTLYTNCEFGFLSEETKESKINYNSFKMELGLNDFCWGKTSNGRLTARDYINWFHETIDLFDKELTNNESNPSPKDCIVVTHFCPSPKFIAEKYRFSHINSAYISDLEWFIEKHPSIKLWVCGHIHSRIKTEIERPDGSKCLLLANPRGYCRFGESHNWSPDVFVETDNWELFTNKNF